MNELKVNIGETEVNIKKVSTVCTPETIEDVVLEYVGRRSAKAIIATVSEIVGDEVVAEVDGRLYKIVLNNGVPSFVVYNIKKDIEIALMEKGFAAMDAVECAEALLATKTSKPDWIPEGFEYYTGDLETGYVVKDKKGNEFTYVPEINQYISRYEISKGDDGEPMSVPGKHPWGNISHFSAMKAAKSFKKDGTSDLIEVSDWEKLCEFLSTKIDRTLIFNDSTSIGAYRNNGGYVRTGENPTCMTYNIDCLAGSKWCMTNGYNQDGHVVLCGGSSQCTGDHRPMASTVVMDSDEMESDIGFRIVLKQHCITQ